MENPLCSGVTFSGGEPFCQPEALYELGSRFKDAGKHLMCYSGWTFEELLKKSGREEYVGKLLSILDVLGGRKVRYLEALAVAAVPRKFQPAAYRRPRQPYKWRSSGASRMTVTKL